MKKSLSIRQYMEILRDIEHGGHRSALAELMKQWDEARMELNPKAKWYGEKDTDRGFWEATTSKDKYICSKCKKAFKIPICQSIPTWNYCPKCGSKNQEEKE